MEKLKTMLEVSSGTATTQIHHTTTGTHYTTIGTHGTPSYVTSQNLYSTPVLIDTIVTKDYIELVYKRQYMMSIGYGMPNPEIYKDVYSRHGGDVRRVIGTYIPAQTESYEFKD
jgi:hypothetical protein